MKLPDCKAETSLWVGRKVGRNVFIWGETSWAEVPKGLSDLGPKWKKAEVTGYPAEYYGFAIFHIMIYIYFIAALSHRQRLNSYYFLTFLLK